MIEHGYYRLGSDEGKVEGLPEHGYFLLLVFPIGWIVQITYRIVTDKIWIRSSYGSLEGVSWIPLN